MAKPKIGLSMAWRPRSLCFKRQINPIKPRKEAKQDRKARPRTIPVWAVLQRSTGQSGLILSLLKYSWDAFRCLWPPFIIRDLQTFELEPGQRRWRSGSATLSPSPCKPASGERKKKKLICSNSRIAFYCRRVFWVQGREVWGARGGGVLNLFIKIMATECQQ